jgi:hypothetical protein
MAKKVEEKKPMGRKPIEDPKEKNNIFVKKSIVKKFGGWDELRIAIYKFLGQD